MPITNFSRNAWLSECGNQGVRRAMKAVGANMNTAYDLTGQTVTNSTVLVPETNLVVQVVANTFYQLEGVLAVSIAAAANNIKLDLNGGTATVNPIQGNAIFSITASATTLTVDIAALNTSLSGGTTTVWTKILLNAGFYCTASGTIQLQFAQVAGAANNTTISPGSWFQVTPLDHVIQA
jgi:hypothetical protein